MSIGPISDAPNAAGQPRSIAAQPEQEADRVDTILTPLGAVGLFLALVGIWVGGAIGAGALAVAIVGPRRRSAVIRPAVATMLGLPVVIAVFGDRGLPPAVVGLVAIPVGVALIQRFVLNPAAASHAPRRWWVVGGLIVGTALGLLVGVVVSVVSGEDQLFAPFVPIGAVLGLVLGWRRPRPAIEDPAEAPRPTKR
jgi:hypothetical protein